MKHFTWKTKKNGNLIVDGEQYATEARYDIIAEDEAGARLLIESEGADPDEYVLQETSYRKNQLGRDYPESIRDARV